MKRSENQFRRRRDETKVLQEEGDRKRRKERKCEHKEKGRNKDGGREQMNKQKKVLCLH